MSIECYENKEGAVIRLGALVVLETDNIDVMGRRTIYHCYVREFDPENEPLYNVIGVAHSFATVNGRPTNICDRSTQKPEGYLDYHIDLDCNPVLQCVEKHFTFVAINGISPVLPYYDELPEQWSIIYRGKPQVESEAEKLLQGYEYDWVRVNNNSSDLRWYGIKNL